MFREFYIGALSGAAAMTVYTPFHYFQNRSIQKLPIVWNKPVYWFRGLPSLALGKAPSIGLQMASFGAITKNITKNIGDDLTNQQMISAAMISGGISGMFNNLTHLIALQQENNGTTIKNTIKRLGFKNCFMRGLGTTIIREMLFINIYMNFLQPFKKLFDANNIGLLSGIISGGISGVAVVATTQPLMVIGSRLYADMEKKKYTNGLDALKKIYKENGIRSFYKASGYRSVGVILALPVLDYVQTHLKS